MLAACKKWTKKNDYDQIYWARWETVAVFAE